MEFFRQSELEATIKDARSSVGRSPEERAAAFVDLTATIESILVSLSPEERSRRAAIARQLDPLPDPWWKNFRPEALAEYRWSTSSI
jgi:hypothetical protein